MKVGKNFKRPAVVFNLDNPMHRSLYEWCEEQSSNFSDFVRTILFAHKQMQENNQFRQQQTTGTVYTVPEGVGISAIVSQEEKEAKNSIF